MGYQKKESPQTEVELVAPSELGEKPSKAETMLDWGKYTEIADRFQHKAKAEDREDLRQDIILRLAEVASNNGHKPFTEGAMIRVASYTVMSYWRDLKRKPTILSLNGETEDEDGDRVELWETLADDKAMDLEAWLDAKTWLLGCPKRLVEIACKRYSGKPLNVTDRAYLSKWHKKAQKSLFEATFCLPSGTI